MNSLEVIDTERIGEFMKLDVGSLGPVVIPCVGAKGFPPPREDEGCGPREGLAV